jgi:hypothetical protein
VFPSPHWFLYLTGFRCASKALTPTCQEDESPSASSLSFGSWWDLLLAVQGVGDAPVTREVVTHHLCNSGRSPKKCCGKFASWDTELLRQIAGSNILLCQHRPSGLMSKGWALRTKESHLIYPCSRLQKQKARSNPYTVLFNFIGYFILVPHDFPLPSAT